MSGHPEEAVPSGPADGTGAEAEPKRSMRGRRTIRSKQELVQAWLEKCVDGSATFPVNRWGRPDIEAISQSTMGTQGTNLKPGHPIRTLIDAHWETIRHRAEASAPGVGPIRFDAEVVRGEGVAGLNASDDAYAVVDFDVGRFGKAMEHATEALTSRRVAAFRATMASHGWWRAFDAWRAVEDANGFELWLRRLMGTPTTKSKNVTFPLEVLGLLRLHGLLLLPLGLMTGRVPHPCSSWYKGPKMPFAQSALTDWERALLPDARPGPVVALLLTVGPMHGVPAFPDGAFMAGIGRTLSRGGLSYARRHHLASMADDLAAALDHQVALGSSTHDPRPGDPQGAPDTCDDEEDRPRASYREALDRHLRGEGVRGKDSNAEENLRLLKGGTAGEWADLLLRFMNAQNWRAPNSRFATAKLIVEHIASMPVIPRLGDADLRSRLLDGPHSFVALWPQTSGCGDYMLRSSLKTLRLAFKWHARSDPSFKNPISISDLPAGDPPPAKSDKAVLPREIIDDAKDICRQLMDLAWSEAEELPPDLLSPRWRTSLMVTVPVPGRGLAAMVSPVLATLLYTLLCVPVRGVQARLLDSGEADGEAAILRAGPGPASTRVEWAANAHPLATAKRRHGMVRRILDPQSGTHLLGLWINTNKTAAQGRGSADDRGYEIPWQNEELIEQLLKLRDWQTTYNPVDRLLSRGDLSEPSLRPTETMRTRMTAYAFLFRNLRDDSPSRRLEPARQTQLLKFFLLVLEEIEFRRRGTPGQVKLITARSRGAPKAAVYTIHGLRVTGITAFVAAGVPLPIIAEFLAGHLNVLMTIYYTKLGPAKVTDILEQALAASRRDGRDDTIGGVPWEVLRGRLIGNPGSSAAGLSGANTSHFTIGTDGLCPNGQSRCHEGGQSAASDGPVPTPGGARNCPLCRFWASGEPFLAGQVVAMNALLYQIKEKGEALVASYTHMRSLPADSSRRHAVANAVDTTERDMDIMVRTLQARYGMVLRSLEHASARDAAGTGDVRPAIIGNSEDVFVGLAEVSELRFLDTVSKAYELLPGLSTPSAPIRRGVLLDRLFDAAGIDAGLFRLPSAVAARAGGLLTDMLIGMTGGEAGLDDLAAGRTTLASLGLDRVRQGLSSALAPMLAASLPVPRAIGGSNGAPS